MAATALCQPYAASQDQPQRSRGHRGPNGAYRNAPEAV